jgi:hypothetical protein
MAPRKDKKPQSAKPPKKQPAKDKGAIEAPLTIGTQERAEVTPKPFGRPPSRTPEEITAIKIQIIDIVNTSTLSIRKICDKLSKEIDNFPCRETIIGWLGDDKEFANQYARAKENQCDLMAEEIIDISDDDSLDLAFNEDGKAFVDKEHINRSRLRVDTRKWILSKLKPKKYGDKLELEHTGNMTVEIVKFSEINENKASK